MKANILLCSVGGQRTSLYFKFFEAYAKDKGLAFRIAANKGFSPERCTEDFSIRLGGGFGEITEGGADIVLALEQLEAVRFRHYPSDSGAMIVSSKRIVPSVVIGGSYTYPTDCFQKCINDCFKVYRFEGEPLYACLLCLRLLGESENYCRQFICKDEVEKLCDKQDYINISDVFCAKPVKA